MPIYEYKCDNGHVFEVIQKITDEPLSNCEECGAHAARVLYSPAVHFKGSGFYNTDYGKKKGGGANGASAEGTSESKSSESSSSSDSSSKSESKAGSAAD
jgi:putative FmdB family regulatory protein